MLIYVNYVLCRLDDARQMHEMLIEKLKVATESSLSAEERAARMDEIMSEEELRQKDIETELKRLRDLMFRKTQELHKTRTDERNTEAEIQVRILEFRKKRKKGSCSGHRTLHEKQSDQLQSTLKEFVGWTPGLCKIYQ